MAFKKSTPCYQNPSSRPPPTYRPEQLGQLPDGPVEETEQLAGGQVQLLRQLVHRLMLQAQPDQDTLKWAQR